MTNKSIIYTGGGIRGVSNRVIGLDILRVALAMLIYMFHSRLHMGCSYSYLNDFVSVGAIAMTGFFMLSGYALRLVYGDQDLMEKHNLAKFYVKRLLSIFPLYYFFAILYILILGKESLADNILLFPIEALGLQTTFTSLFSVTHNSGTWFISCILLAYLIYPLLQTICKQMREKTKVGLLLLMIFVDVWGAIISQHFNTASTYDNPFYRIVEFACGLLVADINMECNNNVLKVLRNWVMLICSVFVLIAGVSIMQHYLHYEDYMRYNVIVLPCFITMLFGLGALKMPILERTKVVSYLGKISYAFFLVQFFAWSVSRWVVDNMDYSHNWFKIVVSFTFCALASIMAYEIIQKPIVKFVNKRF